MSRHPLLALTLTLSLLSCGEGSGPASGTSDAAGTNDAAATTDGGAVADAKEGDTTALTDATGKDTDKDTGAGDVSATDSAEPADVSLDVAVDAGADTGTVTPSDVVSDAFADTSAGVDSSSGEDTSVASDAGGDGAAPADGASKSCKAASECPALPCLVATCDAGVCGTKPAGDGATCDTGSACVVAATCQGGKCVVATLKDCDDGNVCTADTCDAATGKCAHKPALDGAVCSDGSACTLTADCYSGVCVASKKVDCDDADPCTADICDPKTGACLHKPGKAGTACDDGSACTTGDTCDASGACVGGKNTCACQTTADCAAKNDDDLCNGSLYCNPKTNACEINPVTVVTCPDTSAGQCSETVCVPKTGQCQVQAKPSGIKCDDGNQCSAGDVCDGSGQCTPGNNVCSCIQDADCKAQEDGDVCTGTLYCDKSQAPFSCKVNQASIVVCPKGKDTYCSKSTCDPVNGQCKMKAQANSTPCEDGDVCTKGDTCLAGKCKAGTDTCKCKTDTDCAAQENGNLCDGTLYCNKATGQCDVNPATVVTCKTGADTFCAQTSCQPKTGDCVQLPSNVSQACDDGNACTVDEVCDAKGKCTATTNTCACKSDADCAKKEDGDLCNGTLFCNQQKGECQLNPSTVVTCPSVDDTTCKANLCIPKTGKCQLLPRNEGKLCDADGNACTTNDYCLAGSCKAGVNTCECQKDADCASKEGLDLCSKLYCDLSTNSCTVNPATVVVCSAADDTACSKNVCQPKTGKCAQQAANEGGWCDADGSLCTVGDKCVGGTCQAGPNTCECVTHDDCKAKDDNNPCTGQLVCSPKGQCVVNPATVTVCQSGSDTTCMKNLCDPKTGKCAMTPQNFKVPCGPGTVCTGLPVCDAQGKCSKGAQIPCDDKNPCTKDSCDDSKGCVYTATTGGSCEDGNQCTTKEVCVQGVCTGQKVPCPAGTPCTLDHCDPLKGCVYEPKTGSCEDGSKCTSGDTCIGVACVGKAIVCDDKNPCTTDSCLPSKGCVHAANTLSCTDGDACTKKDTCAGGSCVGLPVDVSADCGDGNACTDETCDKAKGCVTTKPSKPCSDGDACTTGDTCLSGVCKAGLPDDCDDKDGCTADSCDAKSGCVNLPLTSTACDDGNACTSGDVCNKGKCLGVAVSCDGGTACTKDSCHPLKGCQYEPRTGACDDGSACTKGDTCQGKDCVGAKVDCDDKNPCTDDSCDPKKGCVSAANTASCDDGDACTSGDACAKGACAGQSIDVQKVCGDGNPCTDESCDKVSGCVTSKPLKPCDDGDICTSGDMCNNGKCVPGTGKACDDKNPCTTDTCDPKKGCSFVNVKTGTLCDDGKPCTFKANCVNGACLQLETKSCDDGNPCTDDTCVTGQGCQHKAAAVSVACDDGDACTLGTKCSKGACAGGVKNPCDDGEACTADSCDAKAGCAHKPKDEGSICADGVACQEPGKCTKGVCVGAVRRAFYQTSTGGGGTCQDALELSDGSALFVGTRAVAGTSRPLAMRVRFTGKPLWESTDSVTVGGLARARADGAQGWVAAGWADSGLAGGKEGLITRINGDGKYVARVAMGGLKDDELRDIADIGGGWIAGGANSSDSQGGNDGWLVRLDDKLNVAWTKTYGLVVNDEIHGVAPPAAGKIDQGVIFAGVSGNSGWYGKVDGTGKLLWDKREATRRFYGALPDGQGNVLAFGGLGKTGSIDRLSPSDGARVAVGTWASKHNDIENTIQAMRPLDGGRWALAVWGRDYYKKYGSWGVVLDKDFKTVVWQSRSPIVEKNAAVVPKEGTSLMVVNTGGCGLLRTDAWGHTTCAAAGNCHKLAIPDCDDKDACTKTDWCDAGKCTHSAPPACKDATVCTTDACDKTTGKCTFTPLKDGSACTETDKPCAIAGQCSTGKCVGAKLSTWGWGLSYGSGHDVPGGLAQRKDGTTVVVGSVSWRVYQSHKGWKITDQRALLTLTDTEGQRFATHVWKESGSQGPFFDHGAHGVGAFDKQTSLTLLTVQLQNNASSRELRVVRHDGTARKWHKTIGDANSQARFAVASGDLLWSLIRDQQNGSSGNNAFVFYRTAWTNGATTRHPHLLGNLDNDPKKLDAVAGGGVVVVGRARDSSDNKWHAAVARLAANGALQWKKLYADDNPVVDVAWTSAGPVVLGQENVTQAGSTVTYVVLRALDPSGKERWTRKHLPTTGLQVRAIAGVGDRVYAEIHMNATQRGMMAFDVRGNQIRDVRQNKHYHTYFHDLIVDSDGSTITTWNNNSGLNLGVQRASPFGNTVCAKEGKCLGKAYADCDDKKPCTIDLCSETEGCVHKGAGAQALCDDGDACSTGDSCGTGVCKATGTLNCDDGNACTTDSCDKTKGCQHANNTDKCDDGSVCTKVDACAGGSCKGGSPLTCDDGKPCTADTCDAKQGCQHKLNQTGPCDDGDKCTANDQCQGGVCKPGAAPNCDDKNPCTTDSCDKAKGCVNAPNTQACDDGDTCTTNDACKAGKCQGGNDICLGWSAKLGCDSQGKPDTDWTFSAAHPGSKATFAVDAVPSTPKPVVGACTLNLNEPDGVLRSKDASGRDIFPDAWAQSPEITLPSTGKLSLHFEEYFDFITNLFGNKRVVQISDDGFKTWTNLTLLAHGTIAKAWHARTVDLSAWAGKKVQLRFQFYRVYPMSVINSAGWFIDNVRIRTKAPCAQASDCGSGDDCGAWACQAGECKRTASKADGAACNNAATGCGVGATCRAGTCQRSYTHCDDGNTCTLSYCSGSCQHLSYSLMSNSVCADSKTCGSDLKCTTSF